MAMHKVTLTDHQLDLVVGALQIAARYTAQVADNVEDKAIRGATRTIASQYGELRRQLKDGQLAALVRQGSSPAAGLIRDPLVMAGEASSSAPS